MAFEARGHGVKTRPGKFTPILIYVSFVEGIYFIIDAPEDLVRSTGEKKFEILNC